jgi:hypothetical protein
MARLKRNFARAVANRFLPCTSVDLKLIIFIHNLTPPPLVPLSPCQEITQTMAAAVLV